MAGPYQRVNPGDSGNSGATAATTLVNAHSSGLEALEYRRFNVRDYGAVGDGSTNDTSAFNSAIAAMNSAGSGVLVIPPGDYATTGGLTTITAAGGVLGFGCGDALGANVVSKVRSSSSTANLFTSTTRGFRYEGVGMFCTASSPTGGAAIYVTNVSSGVGGGDGNRYYDVSSHGFYDGLHVDDGAEWFAHGVFIYNPVRYGWFIKHTDLPDGGDQSIVNCQIIADTRSASAGIRLTSGGGLKLTNVKTNYRSSGRFTYAVDCEFGTGVDSGVILIGNCSFENYASAGVRLATTGSGILWNVVISGNEFAPYTTGTNAVLLSGASTSNLMEVIVTGNEFVGQSGTGTAIVATNVGGLTIGPNHYAQRSGFTYASRYSLTGCTNVRNFDALI